MIITINNDYRIRGYKYGWIIEKLHHIKEGKKAGQTEWRADSPAYPASLAAACESVMERILKSQPDTDLDGLENALRKAVADVRNAFEQARHIQSRLNELEAHNAHESELRELEKKIATESAIGLLECEGIENDGWLDISKAGKLCRQMEVPYLELRGLLEPHESNPDLVRLVNDE